MTQALQVKNLFKNEDVQKRFEQLLGQKAQGFITSVLQIVNSNNLLKNADPQTVLTAAATAATLDLNINQNLGFAYIVPYKGQAQFQIGWKGFVQLAQRSGKFKKINVIEVYENQFESYNRLTEDLIGDFSKQGEGEIVGYVAYFKLINGFEKTEYWTIDEVKKHATKYSQTYNKKNSRGTMIFSPWNDKDQFHAMAKKTVLKNTLSKYGSLSTEMQTAQLADQSVQSEEGDYHYVDNEVIDLGEQNTQEEVLRITEFINTSDSLEKLQEARPFIAKYPEIKEIYDRKLNKLSK